MSDPDIENNSPDTGRANVAERPEETFAAMLERTAMYERLSPGQKVTAKVVSISGDTVYIDLGGKSEGVIDRAEFVDEEGVSHINQGATVEAFFVAVQDGFMKLTTLVRGYSAATLNHIRDAFEAGVPVNGEVKKEIRGGFEISVGGVRGFCPFSQIDIKGARESSGYLGLTLPFKVLEYEEDGKRIVLSRRLLLEEEKEAKLQKLKENLTTGMSLTVEVKSIQNFGAFVDMGGTEGLVPVSEISWDRSAEIRDILSIGQKIAARIISLDWEKGRHALSIKALQPDPWAAAEEKYPVDGRVSGQVIRLSPFGAFVKLERGIEGLIHISNLGAGRRINHPKEVIDVGQWVEVYILSVDTENRKISLSMQPKIEPARIALPSVGEIMEGVVERVMPYGIFVKLSNGISGLIPNQEMGTPPGTDHRRAFPSGSEIQVAVIDVDTANNKVRLSRKAVMEKSAQDEFDEYKKSVKTSSESSGKLSLGQILKAKLEEKNNKA